MDKRSYEIKKLLRKTFPTGQFKVKIKKFAGGEAIKVKTDLLKEWTEKDTENHWLIGSGKIREVTPEIQETLKKVEYNNQIKKEIEKLLQGFTYIARDEFGEILAGGNTYLDVDRLE